MNASHLQSTRDPNQSGFTLIELIITLTVGAILAAVAIPSFTGYVGNSRIVSQTNEIIGTINRARSEAMKRNELVIVCASNVDRTNPEQSKCDLNIGQYNRGWITYANARIDPEAFSLPVPDNFDPTKAHQELLAVQFGEDSNGLSIRASEYGQHYFGFAPDGSLRSFDASGGSVAMDELVGVPVNIAICDERGEDFGRVIQVLFTGRTRIIRPEDGDVNCVPAN